LNPDKKEIVMLALKQELPLQNEIQAGELLSSGAHTERTFRIQSAAGAIRARVFIPSVINTARHPLLALHGISRKDKAIFAAFKEVAEKTGRVLIVPRFSRKDWPEFQRIGRARPDRALLSLLSVLRSEGVIGEGKIDLFGFSGGAQLANRFALLYPHLVGKLNLAAAGWYCLPDQTIAFPIGIGAAKRARGHGDADIDAAMRAQLSQFLRIPLRIYVGDEDTLRDSALRTSERLDRIQGPDRKSRAACFLASFRAAADLRGIAANTSMAILPGCGHDFAQCAENAALAERVSF
jgi:pimeloyl-ACP methyl ester carboxylesterase